MVEESRLMRLLGFLPNLRTELALSISFSVVLLIGTVPSGHDSPDMLHNWNDSDSASPEELWSYGLSRTS